MKKIEKTFSSKGFDFKQLTREGDMAIYEKRAPGSECPSYELIHITSHNGYVIGGNKIPPSEVYPGDSQWGVHGWTYPSLELAKSNFKEKASIVKKSVENKKDKKKRSAKYEETYKVLVCPITKQTRKAPLNYLSTKASKLSVDISTIVQYYISRDGLKKLRRNEVDHPDKEKLLLYNGKCE